MNYLAALEGALAVLTMAGLVVALIAGTIMTFLLGCAIAYGAAFLGLLVIKIGRAER